MGVERSDRYITELSAAFDRTASHDVAFRPVPAEIGVDGVVFRHEQHFGYRCNLPNGDIGIVTIPHERMHLIDQFRKGFY